MAAVSVPAGALSVTVPVPELRVTMPAGSPIMVDRMTSKDDWEILIDMQRDQFKVRKAFKTVMKQLDDAVKEAS